MRRYLETRGMTSAWCSRRDMDSVAKTSEHQTAVDWLFYPRQVTSK